MTLFLYVLFIGKDQYLKSLRILEVLTFLRAINKDTRLVELTY